MAFREKHSLEIIDVKSEQTIAHIPYVGPTTVKEVKRELLKNTTKNVEAVFYLRSGDDFEVLLDEANLISERRTVGSGSTSTVYCALFRINYNTNGEKTNFQSNYVINLPRIHVCVNNEQKPIVKYQGNYVRPWLCSFTDFKNGQYGQYLSRFPLDRIFFYCKPYTNEVIIENTKTWLYHMSIAGQFDKDFVVYVGLLSQPESEVMNIHYDARVCFCWRLPYVRVLNTYKGENDGSQYREIARWYPKTNDCTVVGLKEFIEKETGIPVENQVLYHDAEFVSDGRSILKILLGYDKDCPPIIHSFCWRLPYVRVLNTYKGENDGSQYREIARWYPKTNDCTVVGLKEFIEKETGIPVENQMLYHDAEYISDGRSILKILLGYDKDCPAIIHLMCKFNQSQSNELSSKIKELGLKQICSIQIQDKKYQIISLENITPPLTKNEDWFTELRSQITKEFNLPHHLYHLESLSGMIVNSEKQLYSLFFSQAGPQENICIQIVTPQPVPGKYELINPLEKYFFKILGLKMFVLKSLTKTKTLDIREHNTLSSIENFADKEYKIPHHLQIYLCEGHQLEPHDMLSEIFRTKSNADDKKDGILTLNLVSKPPRNLTVWSIREIDCYNFLADRIEMKESLTVSGVTNAVSVLVGFPVRLRQWPAEYLISGDHSYLYQMKREIGFQNTVRLYVDRSICVKLFSCKQCGNSEIMEELVTIRFSSDAVKEIIKRLNLELGDKYCCDKVSWKLSKNNPRHINPGTILSDVAKDLVLNFQAVRSMSLSLKKIFQS
uniref:Ubiquitin-like domain-containing protein n=1 Tax=Clytia hemisphaerica TaxID=252671 RepID=A0A7M5UQ46_9CNID